MRVHHIGYLVKDLEAAITSFEYLGYRALHQTCHDSLRGVDICFLENDATCVELVSPHKGNPDFKSLQKKVGNGPYHICYLADDFSSDIRMFEKSGWLMIKKPQEAPAINGRQVAFFYNRDIGIVELLANE